MAHRRECLESAVACREEKRTQSPSALNHDLRHSHIHAILFGETSGLPRKGSSEPFAVETCGYMGKEAVKFVNRLGDITAESGRITKGAFVRWAMQLLSVTVQQGEC